MPYGKNPKIQPRDTSMNTQNRGAMTHKKFKKYLLKEGAEFRLSSKHHYVVKLNGNVATLSIRKDYSRILINETLKELRK